MKGGYFPVPPVDGDSDLRAEMLSTMGEMGLPIEKHHHEVAQSQHELGTKFDTLTTMADQMQIYKYCVHNVAHSYGKTATFMPKPIYGDNGSGMHTHISIWKARQATVCRQRLCRSVGNVPVRHRRHHQARQGDQRILQPVDQQLQAVDPRVRGAGAAGLFGSKPIGIVPHPVYDQPKGEACRSSLPRPEAATPTCPFPP